MSKELEDCIGTVGFTDEEKEQMTCIIAGILHCGDIVIPPSDMNSTVFSSGLIHSLLIGAWQTFSGDEAAKINDPGNQLAKMCTQLGIDRDQMEAAMTTNVSVTRGENIVRQYKPSEAGDVRDAIAKAMYGRRQGQEDWFDFTARANFPVHVAQFSVHSIYRYLGYFRFRVVPD